MKVDAPEDNVEVFEVPVLVPEQGQTAPFHMAPAAFAHINQQQAECMEKVGQSNHPFNTNS
jgi:hypothetical protein